MKMNNTLTPIVARSMLSYDPTKGSVTWLVNRRRIKAGTIAGCEYTDSSGKRYRTIGINGRTYSEHRLVFFLFTGNWPSNEVDHIDGDGCNNKWNNLREADAVTNRRNQRRLITNTSGHTGVYWHVRNLKWEAKIGVNGKFVNLGYFDLIDDAIAARQLANDQYGFHANHGIERPL
jgi:hypothetical protein